MMNEDPPSSACHMNDLKKTNTKNRVTTRFLMTDFHAILLFEIR